MKFLKYLILILGSLYLLTCITLYFAQDRIIFNPDKLPEDYIFNEGEELEIEVAPTIFINSLYLRTENSKGVILYLHGNRGSNRRCLRQAEGLMGNQYDILMPDYRGYGKSDGKIESEKQLLSDVQKVYDHLKSKYDESQIVLVGYSLGTGMASYLAANNDPKQLILVAPYISFVNLKDQWTKLLPDFLVKYPLSNQKYLAQVSCPVTLFHGTTDDVIPFQSSEFLSQLNPNTELIPLDNTSHRRSIFHDLFRQNVSRILL